MDFEEAYNKEKESHEATRLKLKAANTESGDRRETIKELNKKLEGFDGIDIDKYTSALELADKASKDKLASQGKVDEIKAQVEGEYKGIIEKANANASKWQDNYRALAIDKDLLSAAAKHNAIDPAEVALLARSNVKMDDEGIVTVVDKDGHTMRNDSGDAMGIDGFMESFLGDRPHHVKASGGGSGSAGGDKGGAPLVGSVAKIAAGLKKLQG